MYKGIYIASLTARAAGAVRSAAVIRAAVFLAALWLFCGPAAAGTPEYMKIRPGAGMTVEAKGSMQGDFFVVTDIEVLDKPRRPKLRGTVTAVNPDGEFIEMYGVRIAVTGATEFDRGDFGDLRSGQRIAVKCRTGVDGKWEATQIETLAVKDSNKIKATITDARVDGVAPDTLFVSGLPLLLVEQTDVEEAALQRSGIEKDLFDDMASANADDIRGGTSVAGGQSHFDVEYRHNYRKVSNFDLTSRFQSDLDDTQPELRARWMGFWSPHVRTLVEARARKKYVLSSDQEITTGGLEAHLTEAFVLVRNPAGLRAAIQLGRQNFDEPREWLYDEYLGAIRGHYYGSSRLGMEMALIHDFKPIKVKFETWTDFLAMVRWRMERDSRLEAYVLARWDSNELRKREPVWMGLRYMGDLRFSGNGYLIRPWLDAALMRGEDKHTTTRGRAVDIGGVFMAPRLPLSPSLTFGYAFASGDETGADDIDNTFRQTGYQDNNARLGGVVSVRYYGVALDPELSNLEVVTVGGGVRPIRGSSLEVFYHKYRQDWPDDRVRGDLVDPPARPNGVETDLGWGAELVVGSPRLWNHVRASWTIGLFQPGEAFVPRQERAYLNKINITVRF